MGRVIPFNAKSSPSREWSAEERARLQELGERFIAAGLKVEVVYGVSEDGDPWCVVKDDAEEVLIHIARIGRRFVIHSAFDDALSHGADLPEILSERLAAEDDGAIDLTSRQAQTLFALIVAASFVYETAGRGGAGPSTVTANHEAGHHTAVSASPHPAFADEFAGLVRHGAAAAIDTSAPIEAAGWREPPDEPSFFHVTDHSAVLAARAAALAAATFGLANLDLHAADPAADRHAIPVLEAPSGPLIHLAANPAAPMIASFVDHPPPSVAPISAAHPTSPKTPEAPDHLHPVSDTIDHSLITMVGHGLPQTEIA